MKEMISRRSFLRVMGLGFGAAMLTACKTGTTDSPADMGGLVDSIAEYNNSANAIGFSVYYYIDQMYSKPGLRLLAVDGVTPGNDTIADESYPLCNEFYAVVHADAAPDSPQRKVYDWLDTDEGRRCIEKAGYVAVD